MNSEIIGNPTTLPWGVIFERVDNIPRHPTQLYEAISYFIIFTIMCKHSASHLLAGNLYRAILPCLISSTTLLEFFNIL
jgi:prolipoprotein diacylglyceryltransferase